tara:strand:+ start:315 stop:536 length:222 start_codon:yes stop_codon:yes gene_type:complete
MKKYLVTKDTLEKKSKEQLITIIRELNLNFIMKEDCSYVYERINRPKPKRNNNITLIEYEKCHYHNGVVTFNK